MFEGENLNGLAAINLEDEKRLRNTVLTLASMVFLFSNIELSNNQMSIFGLEVLVSKTKILSAIRLLLIVSMFALSLRLVEKTPQLFARYLRWRDRKWWLPIEEEIEAYNRGPQYHEEQEGQYHPEWDDELYDKKRQRRRHRFKVISYYRPIATFNRTLGRVFLPFIVGIAALINPQVILILQ